MEKPPRAASFWPLFVRLKPIELPPFRGPRDPNSDQDHGERRAQTSRRDAVDAARYEGRDTIHLAPLEHLKIEMGKHADIGLRSLGDA